MKLKNFHVLFIEIHKIYKFFICRFFHIKMSINSSCNADISNAISAALLYAFHVSTLSIKPSTTNLWSALGDFYGIQTSLLTRCRKCSNLFSKNNTINVLCVCIKQFLYAIGFLYLNPISYLYSHSHLHNLIHHKSVNSLANFSFELLPSSSPEKLYSFSSHISQLNFPED